MFTKYINKMSSDKNIVFIVEDNEMYAKTLKSFIHNSFPSIKEINIFRIGEMCLAELHRNPAVIIMDYFLNSAYEQAENGLTIIKRIKEQKPQTNIIVLSAQENFEVVIEAIKQFDCIYIQKNEEAFNKVKQFIKEIFNRKTPASIAP